MGSLVSDTLVEGAKERLQITECARIYSERVIHIPSNLLDEM